MDVWCTGIDGFGRRLEVQICGDKFGDYATENLKKNPQQVKLCSLTSAFSKTKTTILTNITSCNLQQTFLRTAKFNDTVFSQITLKYNIIIHTFISILKRVAL